MVSNEFYVERLLCKDAAKIVIDNEFKHDLKSKIMFGNQYNNVAQLPKHKNNFKQSKYFKVASGFVICAFVSGTVFKAIDISNINIFAKSKGKSDVIMPASNGKMLSENNSTKTNFLQPKYDLAKSKNTNVILPTVKSSESSVIYDILKKITKNSTTTITNKSQNQINSKESESIIKEILVKGEKTGSNSIEVKSPIDPPKTENSEDVALNLKVYDSKYSSDEKSLVSVKDDGIYVKDIQSSKEKKLIAYNEKTQTIGKPNFTPSEGIIYYKAEKVPSKDGDISEKNEAIYLTDKKGQESTKLVDGKSPMISKDGKKLVYEAENKIFILTLSTNDKKFVDNGKYPAFSDDGKTISYVKEDEEIQNTRRSISKKSVTIKKTLSSLWVFNLATEGSFTLINEQVDISDDSIKSWADPLISTNVDNEPNVTGKYSYYESIWSSDNKEIYAIRRNNADLKFELIKFDLNKQ